MSRVLVIDDEASLRDSIAAYLEDDGHSVLTSATAESALTKLPNFQPDVVVVDLRLEGATGEEFIKAACKIHSNARYIIHTGCKDYILPDEMLALGVSEEQVLFKPVGDLSLLSGVIDRLIPDSRASTL